MHSPTAKLLFGYEKTIIASFIYTTASSGYINATSIIQSELAFIVSSWSKTTYPIRERKFAIRV